MSAAPPAAEGPLGLRIVMAVERVRRPMVACTTCGAALPEGADAIRGKDGTYHLRCAPPELISAAAEEYAAIVRKGVRYFVEKYATSPVGPDRWGPEFLDLGEALRREALRRNPA